MKKEALFAIIVGIIVGLGITYGIYQFRQVLVPSTQTNNSDDSSTALLSASPTPNEKLIIISPENEAVLASTTTTLSGSADSNQMIVVFVNNREYITQADDIGAFAIEVTLDLGSNVITVSSLGADGKQTTKELVVVVSTASLDNLEEVSEASPAATPRATTTP